MTILGEQRAEAMCVSDVIAQALLRETPPEGLTGQQIDKACLDLDRSHHAIARRMATLGDQELARLLWRRAREWAPRGGWQACLDQDARAQVKAWIAGAGAS